VQFPQGCLDIVGAGINTIDPGLGDSKTTAYAPGKSTKARKGVQKWVVYHFAVTSKGFGPPPNGLSVAQLDAGACHYWSRQLSAGRLWPQSRIDNIRTSEANGAGWERSVLFLWQPVTSSPLTWGCAQVNSLPAIT
jgi:hypothetical protein